MVSGLVEKPDAVGRDGVQRACEHLRRAGSVEVEIDEVGGLHSGLGSMSAIGLEVCWDFRIHTSGLILSKMSAQLVAQTLYLRLM